MPINVREYVESRDIQISDDGRRTGRTSWRVTGAPDPIAALSAPGLPELGVTSFPGDPSIVAIGLPTCTLVSGQNEVWEIVYTYGTAPLIPVDFDDPNDPSSPGRQSGGLQVSTLPVFRTEVPLEDSVTVPLQFPNPPANSWPKFQDIGGKPVDDAGKPVNKPHLVGNFQITRTVQGLDVRGIESVLNRRNSTVFFGIVPGVLLFTGISFNEVQPGLFTTTFNFAIDGWFHLRQVAKRDQDSKPILRTIAVDDPLAIPVPPGQMNPATDPGFGRIADKVYWEQPFPLVADFSVLRL